MMPDDSPLPLVSLIVVQYEGVEHFRRCLASIARLDYPRIELFVVDNGPVKVSPVEWKDCPFPVRHLPLENRGYGDGCNQGIEAAQGDFVFLLNNDIELDPSSVSELVKVARRDSTLAMIQPKMMDFRNRRFFDGGAAGGLMDVFGFPFARGRIHGTPEVDTCQYEHPIETFWVSGAALFARKSILQEAGLFDVDYFLYFEEIDLAWRIHLLGRYRMIYCPVARVYHYNGPNLERGNFSRLFYTHRNSLVTLLKNYSTSSLVILFPFRLVFELLIGLASLVRLDHKRFRAVFRSLLYLVVNAGAIFRKRKAVQSARRVADRRVFSKMYKGSILMRWVLSGNSVAKTLSNIPLTKYERG